MNFKEWLDTEELDEGMLSRLGKTAVGAVSSGQSTNEPTGNCVPSQTENIRLSSRSW